MYKRYKMKRLHPYKQWNAGNAAYDGTVYKDFKLREFLIDKQLAIRIIKTAAATGKQKNQVTGQVIALLKISSGNI